MSSTSFETLLQGVLHSSNYERVQFPNLPNMLAYVVTLNFKLGVVLVTNTSYTFFFFFIKSCILEPLVLDPIHAKCQLDEVFCGHGRDF